MRFKRSADRPTSSGLAAGTAAYGRELDGVIDLPSLGGLTTKAVSPEPRAGAPAPRVAEFEHGEAVVAASGGAALLSPRTSIADLVALARGAAIMVSGDTGPTHIAAAVGTPLVGIYGPTRPERNGPWRPADVTVTRADTCECHHLRRCRRDTMCLMDIAAVEVLDAVERRLAAERTRV